MFVIANRERYAYGVLFLFFVDIVFFGIQGSGKGTQVKKLAAELGFVIFEAGGELRKMAASGSELGNTVKEYIDNGKLVPHEIIMRVVRESTLAHPKQHKIIFDGVPRDLHQMWDFDAIMKELGREFMGIHLLLDVDTGLQRVLGRAVKEGRADDANEEIIKRRMQTFFDKTMPVIDEYKKQEKITEIDGAQSEEEVYHALKKKVLGV